MITYTKLRDGSWGVRGPLDDIAPGATVTVTKRSGETNEVRIEAVVWENDEIAIASIAAQAPAPREQAAPEAVEVPAGRYAISLGGRNEVEFFVIDRPTEGKWAGFTFVKQQASDDTYPVKGARKAQVLAAIAPDPVAAMLAYGLELGRCGNCGRTLTDDISREMGIGPDCAANLGIPRPARVPVSAHRKPPAASNGSGGTPTPPPLNADETAAFITEVVGPRTQLDELPGSSWEDIFKS